MRRNNGVEMEVLRPDEVTQLEPNLPAIDGGAHYFPNSVNMDDPAAVINLLTTRLRQVGIRFVSDVVTGIERVDGNVQLRCCSLTVDARRLVIAAGAHSRRLAAQAGDSVPLDTERGYHIEYDMDAAPIKRVVSMAIRGATRSISRFG